MINSLRIDARRLEKFIADFAEIGKTARGGVTRLALSDDDKIARELFIQKVKAIGCSVKIDAIGNIIARFEGNNPELAPILIGSHGDSQPQGGRYDGIYGVVAGLEVLYTLFDHQIKPYRSIDLVMWTNEEGARFAPSMMGSGVFIGELNIDDVYKIQDKDGLTIGEEIRRISAVGKDDFSNYKAHAALEIHIEQGPMLEAHNNVIGVVTGAFGHRWYEVTFEGIASHAGTTPMNMRKDALLGLSRAVACVNEMGLAELEKNGRATVGMVSIEPNSRNVIPGKAWFTVEFRHPDNAILDQINDNFPNNMQKIAEDLGLFCTIKPVLSMEPIKFDEKCITVVKEIAEKLGYPFEYIVSGAGHDACHLSKKIPTSMIFIPCIDGLSHNEAEAITPKWSAAGGNALLHATLALMD